MAVSLSFPDEATMDAVKDISDNVLKEMYRHKTILVIGDHYAIKANVLDVNITTNISDFKTVHFLLDLPYNEAININDIIKVS